MLQTGDIKAERTLERYRAFISYSHVDARVGRWLHRALESYRAPTRLLSAGRTAKDRLFPIFRDREELPASANLSHEIIEALTRSDALIVICSPDAAESQWVEQEIRSFKSLQPHAPVLALLVGGQPGASEQDNTEARECMPLALRRRVLPDGTLTDFREEPIAADIRPGGDGKRLARLKIAAGLLGVPVGALVRRDVERQQRFYMIALIAAAILVAVLASLLAFASSEQGNAKKHRDEALGLVGFMIGDLRKELEPIGRLDILRSVGTRVVRYCHDQSSSERGSDGLATCARALTMMGEIASKGGDMGKALGFFRQAAANTSELLRRDPDNGQRIFDHAQSVYWVGSIDYQRGDVERARAAFEQYRRLAEKLTAIDPRNDAWRAELGYAYSNLGTLFFGEGRYRDAVVPLQKALDISRDLAARKPGDRDLQISLAQAYGWVADNEEQVGRMRQAISQREAEAAIYDRLLADKDDGTIRQYRATAERVLSRLAEAIGNRPLAWERGQRAASEADRLRQADPTNADWIALSAQADLQLSRLLLARDDLDGAEVNLQRAFRSLDWLNATGGGVVKWQLLYIEGQVCGASIAIKRGHPELALEMATTADLAVDRLPVIKRERGDGSLLRAQARILAAEAALATGATDRAKMILMRAEESLGGRSEPRFAELRRQIAKLNNQVSR